MKAKYLIHFLGVICLLFISPVLSAEDNSNLFVYEDLESFPSVKVIYRNCFVKRVVIKPNETIQPIKIACGLETVSFENPEAKMAETLLMAKLNNYTFNIRFNPVTMKIRRISFLND